ncbi:hypothetical protein [Haladaptatus sp. DJG-WS-42]|uniref:hypothetical protein n=1 Tax=Haladaptatus sp. DJG-WS-42 TaxID=3120516 RepID=UPI0030CC3280
MDSLTRRGFLVGGAVGLVVGAVIYGNRTPPEPQKRRTDSVLIENATAEPHRLSVGITEEGTEYAIFEKEYLIPKKIGLKAPDVAPVFDRGVKSDYSLDVSLTLDKSSHRTGTWSLDDCVAAPGGTGNQNLIIRLEEAGAQRPVTIAQNGCDEIYQQFTHFEPATEYEV